VTHNDATKAIVAQGEAAVPALLEELRVAELNQAIYIVFCLRELHAVQAERDIRELQTALTNKARFGDIERDMTLEMQIRLFLRDLENWKPTSKP
jgi:hypothetical protein